MKDKIPDFYLEQYLNGEATVDVARMIENDDEAQARVRELEADNTEILAMYPPGWFADRIAEKMDTSSSDRRRTKTTDRSASIGWLESLRRMRRSLWAPIVPLVALSVLGALLLPRILIDEAQPDQLARGERIKGLDSQIVLYRSGAAGDVERLNDGSVVQAGDRLQISYRSAGAAYGMIISVDGWGVVTLHYPEAGNSTGRLQSDGEIALPYAYILDDAPVFERFYFITAAEPIRNSDLLTNVERRLNQLDDERATTLWGLIDEIVHDATPDHADIYEVTVWKGERHDLQ